MVGFVPTVHAFASLITFGVQDVDARHKAEHDEAFICRVSTRSEAPLTRLVRDDQRE